MLLASWSGREGRRNFKIFARHVCKVRRMSHRASPEVYEHCPCGSGRNFKGCCGRPPSIAKGGIAVAAPSTTTTGGVLERAEQLLRARQFEDALGPMVEGARFFPRNAALLSDLGMTYLFARRLPEAIEWLRRAIELEPARARSHFNLGIALEQSGEFTTAFDSYRKAIALEPHLAEAHGRMAGILRREARRHEEAATAYRRASAAAPGTTLGPVREAIALVESGREDDAEKSLKLLLGQEELVASPSPWRAEAHIVLGRIMKNSGRFDEAVEHFERSLALAPGLVTPYEGLVSSRRLTEADRPLLARIIARIEDGDVNDHQRMMLHFAAGKALDDLKDYASAIGHFESANRIRQMLSSFEGPRFQELVDRLMDRFTTDVFTRHKNLAGGDERPVLIVGMPRSGTTLVERIISSHAKVAGGGELGYWNRFMADWTEAPIEKLAENAEQFRAGYLATLQDIAPTALRVTDKMPFNFLWLGPVHLFLPNARIIHCRRNPVDTCLSIYTTQFNENFGFASERSNLVFYYRQYLRLMEHWRAVLPVDRLLDVDYEEATGAPEEIARKLVAFCGLAWDEACLRPEHNPRAIRTASVWQARQPIFRSSVERWRNYEPWLGELRTLGPG